jgi:hypothetical protein
LGNELVWLDLEWYWWTYVLFVCRDLKNNIMFNYLFSVFFFIYEENLGSMIEKFMRG